MHSVAKHTGRLTCVGIGTLLGAHLTPAALHAIESADDVFLLASDGLVEAWLQRLRPDAASLQPHYAHHASRRDAYAEMEQLLVDCVRRGRHACAVLYGHPGVFAQVGHAAIARLRAEGFEAEMQPGISSADCLYADLGLDPGRVGCQHHEATQLLVYERLLDPTSLLIIWQPAFVGDLAFAAHPSRSTPRQALLVERLSRDYPRDHLVIVYEAATNPLSRARAERMPLHALEVAELTARSTLVVPPVGPPRVDERTLARLRRIGNAAQRPPAGSTRAHLRLVTHDTTGEYP